MAPLNDRNFLFFLQVRHAVAPVVYHELEDTESLRSAELVHVGCRAPYWVCALEEHLVVRVQHRELQLHVIRNVGSPLALCLLLEVNKELNVVFELVVFRVRRAGTLICKKATFSFFIVTNV